MFLKVTRAKKYTYLQLVHSYREGKKVKHRVIANLGSFETLKDNPQLLSIARRLLELTEASTLLPSEIEEKERVIYGHIVYRRLWRQMKIEEELSKLVRGRRIGFNFVESVYLMVIGRLLSPGSKLQTWENQHRYACLPVEIGLNHIYRSLDLLAEGKEELERSFFERGRNLFNTRVDVVFYDVTTFHFESTRGRGLRRFGYSKAGKSGEVQVVLGLLIDEEGVPIGFDLFPGNTYEGRTMLRVLDKLKRRFALRRVIIVSDKAMHTKENLWHIHQGGYGYIVSMSIRKGTKKLQEEVLSEEGYEEVESERGRIRYKVLRDYPQELKDESGVVHRIKTTVVLTWTEERAEGERAARERLLEKAREVREGVSVRDRRGYRRYLKTRGDAVVVGIDEEQYLADGKWDGYYAIQTNSRELTPWEIVSAYHQLWRIEESFRVMKSTMQSRPIFHWTDKRIEGHFVLCFIGFLLERRLELRLREKGIELSPERIKGVLNSLQLSRIRIKDRDYYLKGRTGQMAGKVLRALRIAPPRNVTPVEEFRIE